MSATLEDVADRLEGELVGWLTTVTPDGQPQSTIVWFLRDGSDILFYSRPNQPKVRNIEANPKVAFNLRSDAVGESYVTMEGTAVIVADGAPADRVPAYVTRYRALIGSYGWTPESFASDYSVPIRIRVDRIRV